MNRFFAEGDGKEAHKKMFIVITASREMPRKTIVRRHGAPIGLAKANMVMTVRRQEIWITVRCWWEFQVVQPLWKRLEQLP